MSLSAPDVEYLRDVVARNSGNHLDASRNYLFESRMQRLAQSRGLGTLDDLMASLRLNRSGALERSVAEAMTINETSFFRETAAFDLLREQLLPPLIEARRGVRTLRMWSAASSSGQEAYSLAMMVREHFPLLASWKVEITGTDLSAEMVQRASAGRYQRIEINRGLPARLLLRHMVRMGDEWEVAPETRRLCRFEQRNLCGSPPMAPRFDVILLRNVLIYFPQETRQEILLSMHRSLAPDGALLLSSTEQPRMDSHWETVMTPKMIWYRPRPAP